MVELIMGANLPVDKHHLTLDTSGEADLAYRTIMVVQAANADKEILVQSVGSYGGRLIELSADECLVAVFDSPVNAIQCIKRVNQKLVSARCALYYGQPLTYRGSFFEVAIKHARILHRIVEPGQLVISNRLSQIIDKKLYADGESSTPKILSGPDEKFIIALFQTIEQHLDSTHLDVNYLTRQMGISRTQLYRKITALTGKTPNQVIREFRMMKAYKLIRNQEGNIAFVSQQVGYAYPSYFSRIFRETFGCLPSDL
jgi:AraC-like DNA-binding protein